MPKMKSRSCARKRFKVTANGRVKHKSAFTSHNPTPKTTKRKRQLRKGSYIFKGVEWKFQTMLEV